MQQVNDYIYETKHYTLTKWYKDKRGEVMAANSTVVERIGIFGDPPPSFARFMGKGAVNVDTAFGPQEAHFQIPIQKATSIKEAFAMIDEVEERIRPQVIIDAKEEAMQKYKELQNKVQSPGMPGMRPGPSGLVLPGS